MREKEQQRKPPPTTTTAGTWIRHPSGEGEREHHVDDVDNDADNDTEEEEDMPDVQLAHDQIWDELPVRQRSR